VSRIYSPKLSEALGQQFIVDNRPGAAGNIGAEVVARAVPDGYTLLTAPAALATSRPLYKKINFDLVRDFDPVSMLASSPHILAVNANLPAKNVKELVALARSPEMVDRAAAQGATLLTSSPEQARAFVKSEVEKWEKVIAAAGIRME